MSREAPEWAQVGAEMIERTRGWGRTYGSKTVRIAARLKNGNIRLEGSSSQWRCTHDGGASEAGGHGYHRTSYVLLTPAVRAKADQERGVEIAKRKVQAEADRLEKIWRRGDDEAILAAAAALESTHP